MRIHMYLIYLVDLSGEVAGAVPGNDKFQGEYAAISANLNPNMEPAARRIS